MEDEKRYFSSFNEKEQEELIEKNIEFLKKRAVDWKSELSVLMEILKEKVKPLSFVNLEIGIDRENMLIWTGNLYNIGIIKVIEKMLESGNRNTEMLQKAKETYEMLDEITENYTPRDIRVLNGSMLDCSYEEYFALSIFLRKKEKEKRIEIIKENAQTESILKKAKKLKLEVLYGVEIANEELDELMDEFLKEEKEEIEAFKKYAGNEVEEITRELNRKVKFIITKENLKRIMIENKTIVFDEAYAPLYLLKRPIT